MKILTKKTFLTLSALVFLSVSVFALGPQAPEGTFCGARWDPIKKQCTITRGDGWVETFHEAYRDSKGDPLSEASCLGKCGLSPKGTWGP